MAGLPQFGGLAAPVFIAVFIEFLKRKQGWGKGYEDRINAAISAIWAIAAAATGTWPSVGPFGTLIVVFLWDFLGAFGFHEAFLLHEK